MKMSNVKCQMSNVKCQCQMKMSRPKAVVNDLFQHTGGALGVKST